MGVRGNNTLSVIQKRKGEFCSPFLFIEYHLRMFDNTY